MAFSLLKAEVSALTLDLATRFRDMEASPTERPLNKGRVKDLEDKGANGKLVTFHWSQAQYGGKLIRMNGQHSSTALCNLNGNFPRGLHVHIDTYKVDEKEDLADLFQQFDGRKSGRSPGDISHAFQGLYEEVRDVELGAAKLAIDGVSYYRRTIAKEPVPTGDGAYALFRETPLHPFVRWTGDVFSMKTGELKRAAVVGAMYATFLSNEDASRQFWDTVSRGGVQYDDAAPATMLDKWLVAAKAKEAKDKLKLGPGNFYQGCIYAWNAFREEKPLKDIKSDSKKGFLTVSV
jgi:hypothetical protein